MTTTRAISICLLLASTTLAAQEWRMQPVSIATRWAASVSPTTVWPEYPRPQMVRAKWQNLNGLWDYAITGKDAALPERYDGKILVPYPLESALSGVKRPLMPDERLWYRRTIRIEADPKNPRTLLHFGAVDFEATVYLNGKALGAHAGGYQPFTFDITNALHAGDNTLVIKVYDPSDKGPNPHGKQALHPEWMSYTASSGIWQTVWLEQVPSISIESLRLTPDVDRSELRIEVSLRGEPDGYTVEAIARSGSHAIARQAIHGPTALRIDHRRLWSPDDPYLYDLEVLLLKGSHVIDQVQSYFGMRKIEVRRDDQGHARLYLNNKETYQLGVADQGFWPDGLYTAPSDAALKFDVQAIKVLGFNTVRKHIKIEPLRWYAHCDRLGLLVWQDMPSSNNDSPEARAQFEQELKDNLALLHNHPSIVTWVLFNEGWGAYDQQRLARWMKQADSSRLLNGHSGLYDQLEQAQALKRFKSTRLPGPLGGDTAGLLDEFQNAQYRSNAIWPPGDILDVHYYPGPKMPPMQDGMARVLGEHGSFGLYIEGHVWNEFKPVGRGVGATRLTPSHFLQAYAGSIENLKGLKAQGLAASIYFELFDVEQEHQGFLTYDREIAKVPVEQIARLNVQLVPRAANYTAATAEFSARAADPESESARYERLLAEYEKGRRDLSFLKRLALMALRQGDQARASEVGNAFIARSPKPFSPETWAVIASITRTSNDAGYKLLRMHSDAANAALGSQVAQKSILRIIEREAIASYFKDKSRAVDWQALERATVDRYGPLGREAVYGARMMYALAKEDWNEFGQFFTRYFETAAPRSSYPLNNLSYQVLQHVSDSRALQTAIRVMRWDLDAEQESPVFGRYDPSKLDTYANLLYKVGRRAEALEWQRKAVDLSAGRDREISDHLEKMKAGVPTWGDADETLHVSPFTLPESSLLNEKTRAAMKAARDQQKADAATTDSCLSSDGVGPEQMPTIRRCEAEAFYRSSLYKKLRERYPAIVTPQVIGGVYTEVFTPTDGIAPRNEERVLINVHGGHFKTGSRTISHLESIPIASLGKIKVISVDYRMAPEFTFPAATEDVAAVYRQLLKTYQPHNIGLYGCSAGSLLTAQSIAWFQKEGLPLPAAVGMFGGGASYYQEGDSARLSAAISGVPLEPPREHPYFKGTASTDPLAFPIRSAQIMAKFPPSLLLATTRDIGASAAVYTHSQLVKLGIDAQLHVWEGREHCFFNARDVPEADEAHDVIIRFFDSQLAASLAPGTITTDAVTQVVRASAAGAKLDSDLMKGGGSDDTAALQRLLDRAAPDRALHLIVDGPALISGLSIRGHTTLECTRGGGFYLKDGSERSVLRNANRSRGDIIDEHIVIKDCFLNGNRDHQIAAPFGADDYAATRTRSADRSFKVGLALYGVRYVTVENVNLYNMRAFGAHIANAFFIDMRNVDVDVGFPPVPHTESKEEIKAFKKKHYSNGDGLHFNGPIRYLTIDGASLRSSDDAIALNANDGLVDDKTTNNEFGPYVGDGPITDVTIRNISFNQPSHGIRLLSRNQRIDRVSFAHLTGTVFERFVVVSSWIGKDGVGDIGSVSFDGVNVDPIRFPNWYEMCASPRCQDENAQMQKHGPPNIMRWFEEDAEYPLFSINTVVEHLSLRNIQTKAVDTRPILRIGAHADVRYLDVALTVDDPSRQAIPLLILPGARVHRFDYSLRWLPMTDRNHARYERDEA